MKETFTVFYAWQSDHPGGQCRNLIAEALDATAKTISKDESCPFTIELDQDTQGVPGLCDIPATILAKIQKSDALVADLTYVARTNDDPPRFCSNPNVLFEVGVAFQAIKPERLILVMNEHYGPRTSQIFDLDHRRHPIGYVFPSEKSRNVTINGLAKDLEAALRPIVALGPRSRQNQEPGDLQVNQLKGELEKLPREASTEHWWQAAIYPVQIRDRWNRLSDLEAALIARQSRGVDRHEFPPQTKGNRRHQWGIVNSLYGEPWLASKSGIFLYTSPMEHSQSPYPPRPWDSVPEGRKQQLPAGKWVDVHRWRENVLTFFDFAQRWSMEFGAREETTIELSAAIEGLHLVASGTMSSRFVEWIEPAGAKEYRFCKTVPAQVLQAEWRTICAEAIDAFVELFPTFSGQEFPSSRAWVEQTRISQA